MYVIYSADNACNNDKVLAKFRSTPIIIITKQTYKKTIYYVNDVINVNSTAQR